MKVEAMLCPKCHSPLDDDGEAYICCAGATLRWRCTSCAKLSEGFAFPYGGCPLCGAALERFEPGPVDDATAMGAVRKAFEIELGGQAFYHRAAASTADETLRELFGRFAAMERQHMDTLALRYHVDMTPVYDACAIDCAAVFAGVPRRVGDADDLFAIAIGMEQRAAEFFEASAASAGAGSAGQELYRELAAEEREHCAMLTTEYARWRAGKPGLLGAEAPDITATAATPAVTMNAAALVLTDSGGMQEETTALSVPCLTMRENTERPITVEQGTNTLVGRDRARIVRLVEHIVATGGKRGRMPELWDGRAAERIAAHLSCWLGARVRA
jgi:rubrerythrin